MGCSSRNVAPRAPRDQSADYRRVDVVLSSERSLRDVSFGVRSTNAADIVVRQDFGEGDCPGISAVASILCWRADEKVSRVHTRRVIAEVTSFFVVALRGFSSAQFEHDCMSGADSASAVEHPVPELVARERPLDAVVRVDRHGGAEERHRLSVLRLAGRCVQIHPKPASV